MAFLPAAPGQEEERGAGERALRDLLGLLSLQGLWTGKDAAFIVNLTADALMHIAPIGAVYAQVQLPPADRPAGWLKLGDHPFSAPPDAWRGFVEGCARMPASAERSVMIESPRGPLWVVRLQMAAGARAEYMWFGATVSSYPGRQQLAHLRAAVSLAASGLQIARLDAERARASRAKDEFLAMLGHELRNPLAPIVTSLELIRRRSGGLDAEHALIERQIAHLRRLVDDLLDVSRITSGRLELRREPCELRELLAEAVESVQPLVQQRRHRLETLLPGQPVFVRADRDRLRQVVVNLLVNAARYTPAGGHLALSLQVRGEHARIKVSDSGPGIAPDLLPRIFDLFEQGKRSTDRSEGGLGIGLAIARRLVELHEGRIQVTASGELGGATFEVLLPHLLGDTTPVQQAPAGVPDSPGAGRRVLVVDDNRDAAETLQALLQMTGFEARCALTPEQALELAPDFRPAICLLDIGLPGMDGYELAHRLRQLLPDTPRLVAVTGYGQDSDKGRSIRKGFEAHLTKPVELQALLAALGPAGPV